MKSTSHSSTEVGGEKLRKSPSSKAKLKIIFFTRTTISYCSLQFLATAPLVPAYIVKTHNSGFKKLRTNSSGE